MRADLDARPNLLGFMASELEALVKTLGQPSYRGRQLHHGLFHKLLPGVAAISDLPKAFRELVAASFATETPSIHRQQISQDGTRKYLFRAPDGVTFEAVYIPEVAKGRGTNTLCVSSQTGCSVGCKFCFTASIKRWRNLMAAEIIGQIIAVQRDVTAISADAQVTNIVFMGMGEPLLNYAEVTRAARILMDPEGLSFASRRITISTSGIVPRIYDLGRELPVQLAISLNATTDEIRNEVMPINKKWPLAALIQALRDYPLQPRRRFTIEYVLLAGVNDSDEDARRLARLVAPLKVKINLLPFNPHDRAKFATPAESRVLAFQRILIDKGLTAIWRKRRGDDIQAACGQLLSTDGEG